MQTNKNPSTTDSLARYQSPRRDPPASLEARSYDHWHVDLHEQWEVDFWMKHLGCEEQPLREAVFEVGARVGDVRAWLAAHPQKRR